MRVHALFLLVALVSSLGLAVACDDDDSKPKFDLIEDIDLSDQQTDSDQESLDLDTAADHEDGDSTLEEVDVEETEEDQVSGCTERIDCPLGQRCEAGDCVPDPYPVTDIAMPSLALEVPAFTLELTADSDIGLVNQALTLNASHRFGEVDGALNWSWTLEGSPTVSGDTESPNLSLQYANAGIYLLEVTATDASGHSATAGARITIWDDQNYYVGDVLGDGNVTAADLSIAWDRVNNPNVAIDPERYRRADVDLDGKVSELDVDLIAQAASDNADAPTWLSANAGSYGKILRLIHPELLEPGAVAAIEIGDERIFPIRPLPGYATFLSLPSSRLLNPPTSGC